MKKLYFTFSFFLICSTIVHAQKVVSFSKKVIEQHKAIELNKVLLSYEVFEIDSKDLKQFLVKNPKNANIVFNPSNDLNWSLSISENEIRSPSFVAYLSDGDSFEEDSSVMSSPCDTYAGIANNDPSQFVRLYIDNNVIRGVIFDKAIGYVEIYPLSDLTKVSTDNNTYIIFKHKDLKEVFDNCPVINVSENIHKSIKSGRMSVPTTCRVLEVATDADYEWYQAYGGSSNSSILATMNTLDGVYNSSFNLRILVVFQNVYTTASDPYSSADGNGLLTEFKNFWNTNRASVGRDLAHLFSGKYIEDDDGVLYGLAYTNVVCANSSNSYAFTLNRVSYFETTAHEIGHNLGGSHPSSSGPECMPNRTLMCQGTPKLMSFSAPSITEIEGYISANESCLLDLSGLRVIGDDLVCTSGSYSINSPLNIGSISWSSGNSSMLTINSSTGAATRVGSAYGRVNVNATLNSVCTSGTITITKTVWVGPPDVFTAYYDSGIPASTLNYVSAGSHIAYLDLSGLVAANPTSNVAWNPSPSIGFGYDQYFHKYDFTLSSGQTLYLNPVSATNVCGTSNRSLVFAVPSGFLVYPNPASEYLYIQFENVSKLELLPEEINLLTEKSTIPIKSISLEETFNNKMFKEGNKVALNVSDLERGIYYLHIVHRDKKRDTEKIRILLE